MVGNVSDVEYALKHGHNVDERLYGQTPVMIAAGVGHVDVLSLLLRWKGDVNAISDQGATALFYAVGNGHANVVRVLLEHASMSLLNELSRLELLPRRPFRSRSSVTGKWIRRRLSVW